MGEECWFRPSTWPEVDLVTANARIKTRCAVSLFSAPDTQRAANMLDEWCIAAETTAFSGTAFGRLGDSIVEYLRFASAREHGVPVDRLAAAMRKEEFDGDELGAAIAAGPATRGRGRGRSPSRGRSAIQGPKNCFACGKPGHVAANCDDKKAQSDYALKRLQASSGNGRGGSRMF